MTFRRLLATFTFLALECAASGQTGWTANAWPATDFWRLTNGSSRPQFVTPANATNWGVLKDARAADIYHALAERYAAAGQTMATNLWPRWYRFDRQNRANAKAAISLSLIHI